MSRKTFILVFGMTSVGVFVRRRRKGEVLNVRAVRRTLWASFGRERRRRAPELGTNGVIVEAIVRPGRRAKL
jgi:hypothetical protein